MVQDFIDEALKNFQLSKETLDKGYYYSNHELVGIYLCETDYLLYFTGDSWLDKKIDWIDSAVREMEKNENYKVSNLVWNRRDNEAKSSSFLEIDDFYVGFGFSDQCFLIRTKEFKAPIYNETNSVSERYPEHGGETFEKRVDSWMRNHEYHRLTFKHGYYIHEDFPTSKYRRKIEILMGKYNK